MLFYFTSVLKTDLLSLRAVSKYKGFLGGIIGLKRCLESVLILILPPLLCDLPSNPGWALFSSLENDRIDQNLYENEST